MKKQENQLFAAFKNDAVTVATAGATFGGMSTPTRDCEYSSLPGSGDSPDCTDPKTLYPGDSVPTSPEFDTPPN